MKNPSPAQLRKAAINQVVVEILRTTDTPLTCSQIHNEVCTFVEFENAKWIDVFEAVKVFGQPFSTVGRVKYHDVLPAVLEVDEYTGSFEGQDLELVMTPPVK